tara:strand:+ start:535 stop:741 length:207 start_codon:yes stop_codon:yes gene_type:complete
MNRPAGRGWNTINVKGIKIEIRRQGCWYDNLIVFYTDPGDDKHDIVQYLYDEGFIIDRRTPVKILELS